MKRLLSMVLLLVILFSFTISYAEITPYETSCTLKLLVDKDKTDVYFVDLSLEIPLLKYVTSFNSIEFSTGIPEEKFIEIMQKVFGLECDKIGKIQMDEAKTKFKPFHFYSSTDSKYYPGMVMVSDTTVSITSFRVWLIELLNKEIASLTYFESEEVWLTFEEILENHVKSDKIFLIDLYGNGSISTMSQDVSLGVVDVSKKAIELFLPMDADIARLLPMADGSKKINSVAVEYLFKSILCNGRTPVKSIGKLSSGTDEYEILPIKEKSGITKEVRIYYADDGSLCFDAMLEALMEVINSYGGITPVKGDLHGTFEQVIGGLAQDVRVNTPR